MHFRRFSQVAAAIAFLVILGARILTAQSPAASASIAGKTTTQHGDVLLPGVLVTLIDSTSGATVATTSSDEDGAFTFAAVAPGDYRVRAALEDFQETTTSPLQIRPGQQARVPIDLPISIHEVVNVTPLSTGLASTTALPAESVRVEDLRRFDPVSTSDVQNVLALMPGAVHTPGGGPVSINGGRPTQTRVQVDGMSIVDPITGRADIDLPADAIDSVQILPNPSGGDTGRLSAGVIQFRTRQGPSNIGFSVSNFVPEPLFRDGSSGVHGIRDFTPRIFVGGPLVKDRLFFAESLLYEHYIPRVYGVAETAATETTRTRVNSFTRLDAVLSANHTVTLSFDAGPRNLDQIGVGHFLAPSVAANQRIRPFLVAAAERSTLGHRTTLESDVAVRSFSTDVGGAVAGAVGNTATPEVISPNGRTGNYFNTQHRDFKTVQWKETLTTSGRNRTGSHLFKVGADVLYGTYNGSEVSAPIELRRADGTLAERIDFTRAATEQATGTDAAIYAGDAWTPWPRLKIEPSVRLERDATIGRTNFSPHVTVTLGTTASGKGVLHAAVGRFFERTPLLEKSFGSFEPQVLTRFAADGVSQVGPAVEWDPKAAGHLESPASVIWNAGYEHRFNAMWQVSANVLDRTGSHDFIVTPVAGAANGTLLLDSTGQSTYREFSLWGEFQRGQVHVSASYARSSARGDLSSLDAFYGSFRNPVLQANEYGPTALDVPHRLVAWSSVPLPLGFGMSNVLEYRTGFPFSPVDVYQQYAGPANSLRFPNVFTVDATLFHDVNLGPHVIRLMVRAYNVMNRFNPLEVQSNTGGADFGTFYSHVDRRIALDFDLRK